MNRKNDNLSKKIETKIRQIQEQNPKISNDTCYALIFSLNQYKEPITSLAIDCVKNHNNNLTSSSKLKDHQNYSNYRVKQNAICSRLHDENSKTIKTKKKKYNYGISFQNQSCSPTGTPQDSYQRLYTIGVENLNMMDGQKINNRKNKSFKQEKPNHYITAPFMIDGLQYSQHRENIVYGEGHQRPKLFQNPNSDNTHHLSQSNLASRTLKSNKSSLNKQKRSTIKSQQANSSKKLSHSSIKSLNYPKTETYTSRSHYDIQKLTIKLDSYIKKNIQQPS